MRYIRGVIQSLINSIRYRLAGVYISWFTYIKIEASSQCSIGKGSRIKSRSFKVGHNSTVVIGSDSLIEGSIIVGDNCRLIIGDNFKLIKASLRVDRSSQATFGKDCSIISVTPLPCSVVVTEGSLSVDGNNNFKGVVRVDEGNFVMGSNNFINQGSEIRCEESIEIGDYVLISYFVDIYDTNTHSTDWRKRQQEVRDGYPNRTVRGPHKPQTACVRIGDDVWIGKYAAVLKGVTIGARSIIGTRAVVTRSCPEDSMMVGNPAVNYRSKLPNEDN
jgi:acetyltransferase-like isoleucine patch superfamily enzyme